MEILRHIAKKLRPHTKKKPFQTKNTLNSMFGIWFLATRHFRFNKNLKYKSVSYPRKEENNMK